jgi:hypothetical protein
MQKRYFSEKNKKYFFPLCHNIPKYSIIPFNPIVNNDKIIQNIPNDLKIYQIIPIKTMLNNNQIVQNVQDYNVDLKYWWLYQINMRL